MVPCAGRSAAPAAYPRPASTPLPCRPGRWLPKAPASRRHFGQAARARGEPAAAAGGARAAASQCLRAAPGTARKAGAYVARAAAARLGDRRRARLRRWRRALSRGRCGVRRHAGRWRWPAVSAGKHGAAPICCRDWPVAAPAMLSRRRPWASGRGAAGRARACAHPRRHLPCAGYFSAGFAALKYDGF